MIYIGIDSGLNGAVGVIAGDYVNVWDTPTVALEKGRREYAPAEMRELLRQAKEEAYRYERSETSVIVMIEDGIIIPNRRDDDPKWHGQSARTTARQWRGVGLWEGIAVGLSWPYELANPRTWKREIGISGGAVGKAEAIVLAQRMFPAAGHLMYRARDDGRAEALLIAEYARRRYGARQGALELGAKS